MLSIVNPITSVVGVVAILSVYEEAKTRLLPHEDIYPDLRVKGREIFKNMNLTKFTESEWEQLLNRRKFCGDFLF